MQQVRRTTRSAAAALVLFAVVLGVAAVPAEAVEAPPPVTPNQFFAQQLYRDFFGRSATTDESQSLGAALDAGQITRDQAGIGAASSYAYAWQLVDGFYLNTLGRTPDLDGQAYWTDQIWTGRRSVPQVAAEIYASDEFYASAGGTNTAWVTSLYQRLLGRSPDPGGSNYWVPRAALDGRPLVAVSFYQSEESRRVRTAALYQKLLGRPPDDAGLAYWASQMLGIGDRVVAGLMAGSPEYFARAQVDGGQS